MIKAAICGYGNLGKGVEAAMNESRDIQLTAVFTRRSPGTVKPVRDGVKVYSYADLPRFRGCFDVIVNCGGSATDLPVTTPEIASLFNVVDSFDNHSHIPEHLAAVGKAAEEGGNLALVSVGWDPGLFSLARLYMNAVLPDGSDYTFWGRGVSQGHSDAVRRIEGVADARQYTVPVEEAVERVRNGERPVLSAGEKHTRECYVVAKEGADTGRIREEIVNMPAYFADYKTTVHFISAEEMKRDHGGLPHGGSVIRTGSTRGGAESQRMEFSLKLDSNPGFTGSVLTAFARAVCRLRAEGKTGCVTAFDIPPVKLLPGEREDAVAHLL